MWCGVLGVCDMWCAVLGVCDMWYGVLGVCVHCLLVSNCSSGYAGKPCTLWAPAARLLPAASSSFQWPLYHLHRVNRRHTVSTVYTHTHTHTHTHKYICNTNAYTHICGPEHMQSLTLLQVHVHPTQRCPYLRVVCTQLGQQAVSYIERFHCTPLHMQHTTQDCVVHQEPYTMSHRCTRLHVVMQRQLPRCVWEALFPMATQHKAHTW